MVIATIKLKDTPWKESYDQPRQHIKKQRHYFVNKGLSNQGYGFSNGHIWMWELDCEESWVLKNWCFWTVVLEKTLESPLDCMEIQPSILKEISPGCSLEGLMLKLKLPILWPPDAKSWLIGKEPDAGKDWGQEEKGMTEDEMVWWHHRLNRHGFVWTPGAGDRQGGPVCCGSWGCRFGHDWATEVNWSENPQFRLQSHLVYYGQMFVSIETQQYSWTFFFQSDQFFMVKYTALLQNKCLHCDSSNRACPKINIFSMDISTTIRSNGPQDVSMIFQACPQGNYKDLTWRVSWGKGVHPN